MRTSISVYADTYSPVTNQRNHILKVYTPEFGKIIVKVRPRIPEGSTSTTTPDPVVYEIDYRHVPYINQVISVGIHGIALMNKTGKQFDYSVDNCVARTTPKYNQSTETYPFTFYFDAASGETDTAEDLTNAIAPDWIPTKAEIKAQLVAPLRWRIHELATQLDMFDNTPKWVSQDLRLDNIYAVPDPSVEAHKPILEKGNRVSRHWMKGIGLAWRMLNQCDNPPEVLVAPKGEFTGTGFQDIPAPSYPQYLAFFFAVNATGTGRIAISGTDSNNAAIAENIVVAFPSQHMMTTKRYKTVTRVVVSGNILSGTLTVEAVDNAEQSFRVPSAFFHEGRVIDENHYGQRLPPVDPVLTLKYDNAEGITEFVDALEQEYVSQRPDDAHDHTMRHTYKKRTAEFYDGVHNPVRDYYAKQYTTEGDVIQTLYNKKEWRFTNHAEGGHGTYLYQSLNSEDWRDLWQQYQNALDYTW